MSEAPLWIKICGVTSAEDARTAEQAGADAIGLNLVPTSKRRVSVERARIIADAVRGKVLLVGIVADASLHEMRAWRELIGLDLLQLHGSESPGTLGGLLPGAYKALAIGGSDDVESAAGYPGEWLLVDAKVPGQLGGTGKPFDWALVRTLAKRRRLILAGGLTPDNVADAVSEVRPFGVDVASGVEVEGQPGLKDIAKVRRFIELARGSK